VAFREATHGMPGLEGPLVAAGGNNLKKFVTAAYSKSCVFRNAIK